MLRPVLLALALIAAAPAAAPAGPAARAAQQKIALELRIFHGSEEVTADTRVAVYEAGERNRQIALFPPGSGDLTVSVAPGFYDVQAVREKDGRVMNIRWAERLVVMAYPDEAGRHLEVVNFNPEFGALQVRAAGDTPLPDLAIHAAGAREKEAGSRVAGNGYALFVVPAGTYDLQVRGARQGWHPAIEVPSSGTRLWMIR